VKRVARKMPKDNKVVRKMLDDTKNTLDKIRKMLRCGECQKNIGQCKKMLDKPKKTLKDAKKRSFQTKKKHFNNLKKLLLVYGC
jgi:exonuclease VII large subunit